MSTDRTKSSSSFEKREKEILEFEELCIKNEQQLTHLKELEKKLKVFEEKSSQDEVIAAQLNELREKIKTYEHDIQESDANNARLSAALGQLQEENIKLEDELNEFKSNQGNIQELKSKLKILEETVITQEKELIEKDKILKGQLITKDGCEISGNTSGKFIIGKVETLKEFNHLIENVKFRLFLIMPSAEDLKDLNLNQLGPKVDVRIAAGFNLSDDSHKKIIQINPNIEFRNFSGRDRWGIERDAEEICLVAESENKDLIGISSSDSKICDLFSKLLTEAWLKGEKIHL
ncbi:MAG TPA: hypothetical protein VMV49_18090 [Candidatus Deferrimicrobium sp.]|nr:hypothetical protein [Candidatus Deferrimicrobium sp.]